jgi:hypothetical protein
MTPVINVSSSIGGSIMAQTSSIFGGFKIWIIFIIALVMGFWLFEVLIGWIVGVFERRREDAEMRSAVRLLAKHGLVPVIPPVPIEEEKALKTAESYLRKAGYKIEKKVAMPKPPVKI